VRLAAILFPITLPPSLLLRANEVIQ